MSYSRWSNSSWYTFYNASGGETLDEQVLSAWYSLEGCVDWTYAELVHLTRGENEDIINRIRIKYNCSGDEAAELYDYIQEFMHDARVHCER